MKPRSFDSPKNSCRRGRRRSQHMAMTRVPAWARVTARFAAEVLFPSPCSGLVTWIERIWRSRPRNSTLVRRAR